MLLRAKELGRTHFAYTDHGHLSSTMKILRVMKTEEKNRKIKLGLKLIPGIEIYFKDATCHIVAGTPADRCKYFTASVYCEDQTAYQELCRIASRTDMPTTVINKETQQLWSWADLERISKFKTNLVLGGVHCMVGKPMLAEQAAIGEKVLLRLKDVFKENLHVSIVCEPWTKKYSQVVEIKCSNGQSITCLASDQVSTDRARRIKAADLAERSGHKTLKSYSSGGINNEVHSDIISAKLHKGFLPLPGGDAMLKVNRFLKALANKHGLPILISDYAYYANKEDKIVQTMRLEGNNKLQPNLHMKTAEEMFAYLYQAMNVTQDEAVQYEKNNEEWAKRFDNLNLKYDWRLADSGPDPLQQAMEIIKKNGRMKWDNPVWVDRLREELKVIAKNPKKDLTAYFLPIRDVLNHYLENGLLTGPGRGSAGGSLFCYLLGITQVNPFEYDLPFQRFFSLDRIMMGELPDIDVDLEGRELLVGEDTKSGYLYGRWGNKAAQISTRTTIRLKSAIKDANRYFKGKVEDDIETFTKGLPAPPQGISDHDYVFGIDDDATGAHTPGLIDTSEDLKKYAEKHPEEWDVVTKAMGLTRAFSKHASAFVLSDIPIQDMVPTKEGYVTQYEAKECEAAGLIKYDFLVIHQLKDIRICLDLIKKKHGRTDLPVTFFPHNGVDTFIWDLPKVDDVFKSIWAGSTETCFQINTKSMIPYVMDILPGSIMDLATILALVRPGPLDFIDEKTGRNMTEEYIERKKGNSQPDLPEMAQLLPETFGVIAFQEQLTKIGRDLAGFPGPQAETLRKHMAKKNMGELMKMKPEFIAGAEKKTSPETAAKIWEQMVTFGRYGFSVIHAVEYALITYACMFLRYYYPLEWWAAILTNATEQEISGKFWPFVKDLVSAPDINLSGDMMAVDYANHKIRAKLGIIRGIGEATIAPIVEGRPYKDIQDFVNKDVAGPSLSHKLIFVGVLDSLFPPKSNLIEKLKMFEDAVEVKKFNDKLEKAKVSGRKVKALQPKEGTVPEEYLNLHPIVDAAMKKAVLPSMPIDLYSLGAKYSKVKADYQEVPHVVSNRGYNTRLIDGNRLRRLDEMSGDALQEDVYVASTCFVVKSEEFSYQKGAKRALKMTLDADGYVSEKVLWPNYDSGQLEYPSEFSKGCIATIFMRKKVGKKDMNVMQIVVEK
jgi:DNA-directed DNA polymerase III PolC